MNSFSFLDFICSGHTQDLFWGYFNFGCVCNCLQRFSSASMCSAFCLVFCWFFATEFIEVVVMFMKLFDLIDFTCFRYFCVHFLDTLVPFTFDAMFQKNSSALIRHMFFCVSCIFLGVSFSERDAVGALFLLHIIK